jgi:hypothetical protein
MTLGPKERSDSRLTPSRSMTITSMKSLEKNILDSRGDRVRTAERRGMI